MVLYGNGFEAKTKTLNKYCAVSKHRKIAHIFVNRQIYGYDAIFLVVT